MVKKVLIVDDQYGIRILLKEILEREGYMVFLAANAKQAIGIIEKEAPHLVLLDLKLPGTSGVELLKIIQLINSQVVPIMMTAYEELNLINEAKRNGAIAHFKKPFDIKEVRKMIKESLQV